MLSVDKCVHNLFIISNGTNHRYSHSDKQVKNISYR